MDDFSNLSEEDIQQLMELGIAPDQLESLNTQIASAQKLRDRRAPQGTDTGRVYVAASPLEHLAYAMQGIKAGKDIDKSRAEQQKILAQQVRGRGLYFNKMMKPPMDPNVQNDVDMAY
jgi:hypothetical protein